MKLIKLTQCHFVVDGKYGNPDIAVKNPVYVNPELISRMSEISISERDIEFNKLDIKVLSRIRLAGSTVLCSDEIDVMESIEEITSLIKKED